MSITSNNIYITGINWKNCLTYKMCVCVYVCVCDRDTEREAILVAYTD